MKRVLCGMILIVLALGLTACGENHPVNKVEPISDNYVIEHYTNEFPQTDSLESEMYYISWEGGSFTSVGPTEPGYRAVVSLSSDGVKMLNEYEWTPVDNPQFTQELIDVPKSPEWYMCKQFENDKFKYVNVKYLYFDGADTLVFDIHTY